MAAVAEPSNFVLKDFLKSFMLWEIAKGMVLTGRYAFRPKYTVHYPEEKIPAVAALSRLARAAPL
ncbi:MAG: hypothetical protein HKUEN07_07080 [Rhodocyclaceae bacterium]|nr:MAG: hypothetical protein HKUEN07_07080 [Rhodocyclaceae bacterium]